MTFAAACSIQADTDVDLGAALVSRKTKVAALVLPSPGCPCWTCRKVPRAYLHHLFLANDPTGLVLNTLHSLTCYHRLMARIREALVDGRLSDLAAEAFRRGDEGRFPPQLPRSLPHP